MNGHMEERRKMISEAFHTLNQPLTGLHCGLEIALQKPRSDGEYRQRIGSGLENAGVILQLVRAIRQLVDAADPGERFGTVDLALVLSQLRSELEVVGEALRVEVAVQCETSCKVMADPTKLMAALGTLADEHLRSATPGTQVEITAKVEKRNAVVTIRRETSANSTSDDELMRKLSLIRSNAACCYLWSVGGEVQAMDGELAITLPRA